MSEFTVEVRGLAAAMANLRLFEPEARAELLAELKKVGKEVRDDAASRFQPYNSRSSDGFRVYARARGVDVEQSIGRKTGTRPDFGALQMRKALLPALEDKENESYVAVEAALSALASRFSAV